MNEPFATDREELISRRFGTFEPERTNARWSEEEIESLRNMFYEGVDVSKIAIALQRSEISMLVKAHQEGLFGQSSKGRSHVSRQGCRCHTCDMRDICPKNIEPALATPSDCPLDC